MVYGIGFTRLWMFHDDDDDDEDDDDEEDDDDDADDDDDDDDGDDDDDDPATWLTRCKVLLPVCRRREHSLVDGMLADWLFRTDSLSLYSLSMYICIHTYVCIYTHNRKVWIPTIVVRMMIVIVIIYIHT